MRTENLVPQWKYCNWSHPVILNPSWGVLVVFVVAVGSEDKHSTKRAGCVFRSRLRQGHTMQHRGVLLAISQIHHMLDFGLSFSCCLFRNLPLLPWSLTLFHSHTRFCSSIRNSASEFKKLDFRQTLLMLVDSMPISYSYFLMVWSLKR